MAVDEARTADPEHLVDIIDNLPDAFVVIDGQWRLLYANQSARALWGITRDLAPGRNVFDQFPRLVGTEWERASRLAMDERVPVEFELHDESLDRWIDVHVFPSDEGIALHYRDVTIAKRGLLALERKNATIDGINRILRAGLVARDESELGGVCLEVAKQVTDSPFGFISERRDDGVVHAIAISNPGWGSCDGTSETHRMLRTSGRSEGLHGRVLNDGASFYTNDPAHHPDSIGVPSGHPPLTAFLGTPLREGEETFGIIAVGNRPGGYEAESAALLELVAPAAVEAFRRLRTEEQQRRRARFDRAFAELSQATHSSLDDTRILETAVEEVSRATGLNAIGVHVRSDDGWQFMFSYGLPDELKALRLTDEQAPMSMLVIDSGEPVVMRDTRTDPRANRPLIDRFDIRSLVGFPLIVRGQPFGVLFAGSIGEAVAVGDAEVGFLGRVSSTLSLALDNARLYETEHRIAETLQQALLPLPQQVPGVSFAHAYRSAAEAARVGGDFYDIFEIEHDRIAVVIGDVAGKGLEAAALTSLLRSAIRAHSSSRDASVADVLRMTSELVYKVTDAHTYATVFLAFVDCATGHLTYASGGHPALGIVGSSGVRKLESNSSLVGAFEEGEFCWDEEHLDPNELLVLYTDGVIEARFGGEMYGEHRLFEIASATDRDDPVSVVKALVDDLLNYVRGNLTDDAAIMALKLTGSSAAAPAHEEVSIP